MSVRNLVKVVFGLVLALIAAAFLLLDPALRGAMFRVMVPAGKLFAALGCAAAALAFERGDYLRRAWGLQALSMVLLARDLVIGPVIPIGAQVFGVPITAVNQAIVIAANVAGVYGLWLMAWVWRAAELDPEVAPVRRGVVIALTLLAALAITGVPLARSVPASIGGRPVPLNIFVSGFADIAQACLLAPILLTVLAMRGGILIWPWALLAACLGFWLLYDCGDAMAQLLAPGVVRGLLVNVTESLRVLACSSMGLAGLAQRHAVVSVQAARSSMFEQV